MSRTRYVVTVRYEQEKEITVWAADEDEAKEVAEGIVEDWEGVFSAQAKRVEEG